MIQKHWDLEWAETMTAYQIMNELFKIKKKKSQPWMFSLNLQFEQQPNLAQILKQDQSCFRSARDNLLDCHYQILL